MRSTVSDQKLVKRLLAKDGHAFEVFFNRYFPRLYRFALARLNFDEDLAEESAQQTLCIALDKLAGFRGEAALFTWLCAICRNEISAQIKKRNRAQGDTPLLEDDPNVRAALESLTMINAGNPAKLAELSQVSRLVQVVLDFLPSAYSDALEWKYVHGLTVNEIASRIGKSPKATESTLTRAREAFKDGFKTMMEARSLEPKLVSILEQ